MRDFHDIVDTEGLSPDDEARLRRVHELLVQAGPPADLPPELSNPPQKPREAEILQFPLLPGRRWAALAVAAAAVAAVAFGGGYLFGHSKAQPATFAAGGRVVRMTPAQSGRAGLAVLTLGKEDSAGNWPMDMSVANLPKQSARRSYYELWLTKHGKPLAPCGTFRVHSKTTTVRFTVPYDLSRYDGWVVTAHQPGQPDPGRVVLST